MPRDACMCVRFGAGVRVVPRALRGLSERRGLPTERRACGCGRHERGEAVEVGHPEGEDAGHPIIACSHLTHCPCSHQVSVGRGRGGHPQREDAGHPIIACSHLTHCPCSHQVSVPCPFRTIRVGARSHPVASHSSPTLFARLALGGAAGRTRTFAPSREMSSTRVLYAGLEKDARRTFVVPFSLSSMSLSDCLSLSLSLPHTPHTQQRPL